jgi:hypothetical protein
MPISNHVPNSRISQAGVCTSTTRPSSPYEGQVIYETDTNRTLVWDNSAWVDPSTGKYERSGLVKIIPTSVSNGNIDALGTVTTGVGVGNITVNGAFNSTFDNYRVIFSGGTSSGVASVSMSLGGITTGYYSVRLGGFLSGPTSLNGEASNNASQWNFIAITHANGVYSVLDLITPFKSDTHTFVSGHYVGGTVASFVSGRVDSTSSVSSFTYTSNGGTFSNANIRIYGYN